MSRPVHYVFGITLLCAVAVGCGGDDPPAPAADGLALYSGAASAALGAVGNGATCATCHSNDGTPRSGDTFRNIAYRTSYKGGDAPTLLDAANACVTGWMGGTALTATDPRWTALQTYLQSISDRSVTTPNTLRPEVLANEAAYEAMYAGGDAAAGAPLYARFCGTCHNSNLTVNMSRAVTRVNLRSFSVGRIAQKVRTAGPPPSGMMDMSDSTPGPMPFFEPDELTPTELRDIIAHVRSSL